MLGFLDNTTIVVSKFRRWQATTKDGFSLGVQKIARHPAPSSKGPVFLMHGLLVGGDVWVLNIPSEALGFILVDAGYDVWIGNTRTTRFSQGQTTLQRTDSAYWDWTVDDMAEQDPPAMLDLVYGMAHQKIHYIGYSQGTQQAFAAFSQGQLISYINKVVMLAPVAYVDHGSAPLELGLFDLHVDQILQAAHVNEFSTQTRTGTQVVDLICGQTNRRCYQSWIFLFAGENCCLNITKRELLERYETQATSVKNLAHLAQRGTWHEDYEEACVELGKVAALNARDASNRAALAKSQFFLAQSTTGQYDYSRWQREGLFAQNRQGWRHFGITLRSLEKTPQQTEKVASFEGMDNNMPINMDSTRIKF
ncbi:hypothetical protein L7F22_056267 [Adiantum nelumboides]|nr:hypothetical protein [Adiantum nelumboides]